MTVYNCSCDAAYPRETLANMRTRLMRRLGFSAQAANPPPGMGELLDDFLMEAQRLVYNGYATFRTSRWYTWTMVDGERFYDYEDGTDPACPSKILDPNFIEWVGISRDSGGWTPLVRGIPPQAYTDGAAGTYPTRYELGQCFELWPAPTTSDLLRVRGNFGLLPFAAPGDWTTIDPDTIFLRALGNAKFHYKHPDAGNYIEQEQIRVMELVAKSHATRRYIPTDMRGYRWMDGMNGLDSPGGILYRENNDAIGI